MTWLNGHPNRIDHRSSDAFSGTFTGTCSGITTEINGTAWDVTCIDRQIVGASSASKAEAIADTAVYPVLEAS